MLKNILILLCTTLLFQACSLPTSTFNLNHNDKSLELKTKNETIFKVDIKNAQITSNYDRCAIFSETIKSDTIYGNIFVENINLDSNCYFNQDPSWAFMTEFRDNLKLKSFEKVEHFSYEGYDFYTFKVDSSEYVNFIFIQSVFKYTYIVDYKGELAQELISKIDKNHLSKYLKSPRFEADYDYSLVKFNFFKHYFEKMSNGDFTSK